MDFIVSDTDRNIEDKVRVKIKKKMSKNLDKILEKRAKDYMKGEPCVNPEALDYLEYLLEYAESDKTKEYINSLASNLC